MSESDHNKIIALSTLVSESELICPTGHFVPAGEAAEVVQDWAKIVGNTKTDVKYGVICQFAERLQRLRTIGIPVSLLMDSMAEGVCFHPQFIEHGAKSPPFLEMAVQIVGDDCDINERMARHIWVKFSRFLQYDPRIGGVVTTPAAYEHNISAGNYPQVVFMELQREFKHLLKPRQSSNQYLEAVMMDAIRRFMRKETPRQELERVYSAYKGHLPPLDPATMPSLLSEGKGAWNEIYRMFGPLFEVYGIRGDVRKEELMVRGMLGIVTRTMSPGALMQWALLLKGPGGCGKTSLGVIMALDTAPALVITPPDLSKPRTLEAMAGASVVVLDEMDVSTSKRDVAENKSFLTLQTSYMRKAYRRDPEEIRASWAVIATTNADTLPHDDGAEMRRYGVVALDGSKEDGEKRAAFLLEHRRYFHALLTHLHYAGYSCDLSAEMVRMNRQSSTELIEVPEEYTTLLGWSKALAELVVKQDSLTMLSTKAVWSLVSSDPFHPRKAAPVTKLLRELGWGYFRSFGSGYYWCPPNASPDLKRVPIHPDFLHTLRKALAGTVPESHTETEVAAIEPTPVMVLEAPIAPLTLPVPDYEPTPLGKATTAPPHAPIDDHETKVAALRKMIETRGVTPPETTDLKELFKFFQDLC